MSDIVDKGFERAGLNPVRLVLGGLAFSVLVVTLESVAIVCASIVTGITYHTWVYGTSGDFHHYLSVGGITALLYTLPFLLRDDYRVHKLLDNRAASAASFWVGTMSTSALRSSASSPRRPKPSRAAAYCCFMPLVLSY